jgi:2-(1,2-epoxy-1,2-dihydrophenyl)acetyl-CoA isomerase
MQYETITHTTQDNVTLIEMARPDDMNALTTQMRAELTHAITAASRNDTTRVVVITGQGKAFCSGQDLGDRSSVENVNLERVLRDEYVPMLKAIKDCPFPVVAAVNGPAMGAGAHLALACDVVIATQSAFFAESSVRVGLMPDMGATHILPRQIGMARAMGMALFGEKISADQAQEWGLIWQSVPDADFHDTWVARVIYLANGPTQAFKKIKAAFQKGSANTFDEQLMVEGAFQGGLGHTRDFREGLLAVLKQRDPDFEGR